MIGTVALAALIAATPAPLRPGVEVGLSIERCAFLQRDEVVRLVTLELGSSVVPIPAAGPQATRVEVVCDGTRIGFTVMDPNTGRHLTRAMALTERAENVATRIVALAISELVITSWLDLTPPAPAKPADEDRSRAVDLLQAGPDERAGDQIDRADPNTGYVLILGQATGPFSGVGLGWGGGLRIGWVSGQTWMGDRKGGITGHPAMDVDLTGAWTDVSSPLGTVHVSILSASPRGTFRLRRGRAWMDLGAGGRFGLARLVAAPIDSLSTRGGTLAAAWAGPTGYAGVGVHIGRMMLATGLELGYVVRGVAGLVDEGGTVSIAGHWLTASLAIGWGT